jgi:hypothetical protein
MSSLTALLPLLALWPLLASPQESPATQQASAIEETAPISIDAVLIDAVASVLRDFKSRRRDWSCFKFVIYTEEDNWRVDLVPKDNTRVVGQEALVNVSSCSSGMTYILNRKGKIIRRYTAR